jgi:putative RecB family exonuclease
VKLFKVSPTRLAAFGECPRRYHLAYLASPRPARGGPWAHQSLGNSIHLALSRWWELDQHGRTFAAAGELLDGAWQTDGYRDAEQAETWRARARGWVRAYATTQYGTPPPVGCERTVSAVDGGLVLEGRIDRLDQRGNRLAVVDYKVGRDVPTEADVRRSPALALYAVVAGRTFKRRCARVELHHIPTGTVVAAEHDADSIGRHLARIHDLADDIRAAADTLEGGAPVDAVFPPRPGPLCPSCDYRALCPEGQARGPAAEPWAALERWQVAA